MWLLDYVLSGAVRGNVLLVASSAAACFQSSTILGLWWFRRRSQSDCQPKTLFASAGWLQETDLDIVTPHWNCCKAREVGLGPFIHCSSKSPTTALRLWFARCIWSTCVRQRHRSLTTWRGDLAFNSSGGEKKNPTFNSLLRLVYQMWSVTTPDGKCWKHNESFVES